MALPSDSKVSKKSSHTDTKRSRIIGIDPGTHVTGYGILDYEQCTKKTTPIAAGAFLLNEKKKPLHHRLAMLSREFKKILIHYEPEEMCIEKSFVHINAHTALLLGHARGVLLAEATTLGLDIFEMSPTAAKKRITNQGRASKELVSKTVAALLQIPTQKLPWDATDALALAYAHICNKSFANECKKN